MDVRIGIVTDVKLSDFTARVKFPDEDFTSGWLKVLQRKDETVIVPMDNENSHTHSISVSDTYSGGGSGSASTEREAPHNHQGTLVDYWMPKVNEVVLCLYLPIFNADGFILGRIR